MSYSLGVDLGTTFTAAATANGTGPTMIGLGNRALQVPSVLFLDADHFLVGEAAERRGAIEPDRVAREFKRRLGDHVPLLVGGSPFSAELLTARLLGWVTSTAAERMGEPPENVVLTHPANWGPFKMEVFRQVSTLADVPNVTWIPEPVAAASQYASRARVEVGEKLAIYDLGGGTFDVCVVEKTDDGFRMLGNPDGVEHLGGTDLDHALFERVMASLADRASDLDPDDPELAIGLSRLRRDCVDAKEALSSDVTAVVPVALPGLSTSVRVTRSEFEELIRPSLLETLAATRRGLSSAGVAPSELTAIVLIGGSSRIPLVGEMLQHEFGIPAALDTHPKHDVALGAARLGGSSDVSRAATPPTDTASTTVARASASSTDATAAPAAAASTRAAAAEPAVRPTDAAAGQAATPAAPTGRAAEGGAATADSGRTPSPPKGPMLNRTRIIVILVAVAVITTFVVLLATGALDRSTGGPVQSAPTQSEPNSTSDTQGPGTSPEANQSESASANPPAALPQSAAALSDNVIVWPRVRDGNWDIATINTKTGTEKRITNSNEEDTVPVISQDRRTIIYSRRGPDGSLRVIGADGTGDRRLFQEHPDGCGNITRPAWHETTLAIICESAAAPGASILSLVTLDGAVIRELDHGTMGDPAFTPDGTAVVYWKSTESGTGLFSVAVDGNSAPIRLTTARNGADADPVVSPDGKQLAFRRQTSGPRVIMTMPFDGRRATGDPRARTKGENDQDPSWSPDGKSIAYKHGPDSNGDLWVIDLKSGKTSEVIDNPEPDTAPAWTTR